MEVWKEIAGYEGIYSISDMGRMKIHQRLKTYTAEGKRKTNAKLREKVILGSATANGYLLVRLNKDGVAVNKFMHRLVLESFVGPCPEKMEACHGDGDNQNNALLNLRWDTHKANMKDKATHGSVKGEKHGNSKLKDADIFEIRKMMSDRVPMAKIAKHFGVGATAIFNIKSGARWAHL